MQSSVPNTEHSSKLSSTALITLHILIPEDIPKNFQKDEFTKLCNNSLARALACVQIENGQARELLQNTIRETTSKTSITATGLAELGNSQISLNDTVKFNQKREGTEAEKNKVIEMYKNTQIKLQSIFKEVIEFVLYDKKPSKSSIELVNEAKKLKTDMTNTIGEYAKNGASLLVLCEKLIDISRKQRIADQTQKVLAGKPGPTNA